MGETQDPLRRLLDKRFAFVGVLDVDGTLIELNQPALIAPSIPATDLVGKKFWDCHWWNFSAESRRVLRESIEQAAQGEHVRYDAMVSMAGTACHWMDLQLAPLSDAENRITRIIASAIDITERKTLEERLRASEERVRLASRAAHVGIWQWNVTNGSVYWSEEARKLYGEPGDSEVTYRRWLASLHPDDRERAIETVNDAVLAALRCPGEADYHAEYRVQHRNGSTLWLESVGAFTEKKGELITMGVVRDITERKRAEQDLRDSEERLRFIAERAEVGYWHWDIGSNCLEWSPLCKRLFGLEPDEVMTYERFLSAVHAKDRERVEEAVRACLDSGGRADFDIEYRLQRPDGTVRWAHSKGSAAFEGDRPLRMAGIALDVTDRKQAEKLLAEQSALLEALTSKAPVGFAFVDKACRYVRVNPKLAKMNGVSASAHIGKTVAEVVPKIWPAVEPLYRQALAGEAVANVEVEADTRAAPGQRRYWLVSYYPVRVGARILGVGTVVVDITAQKQAEALLKEADRRKDEFLATLAHELRNPLAPIRNAIGILNAQAARGAASGAVTKIIDRQVHHMVRLIDDLLDVSRINHGKLTLRRAKVELSNVVDQALEASLPLIDRAGHRLTVSTHRDPIYVDADPVRLAQVFSNLLNNAAKYTPRGGEILLRTGEESGQAVIAIRDNGIGIAPEDQDAVFDRFSQLAVGHRYSQEGLGIGLALSKSLIELHGGTIEVRSEGENAGSEFIVRLPAVGVRAAPETVRPGSLRPAGKYRILIADDNVDSAESLAMLLRLMGNEVETAGDGVEAVQKAADFRPEVILLDIRMPKMDGYDACRAIREQPCSQNARIIAVTGCGQGDDMKRSRSAGFDGHLIKPVNIDDLFRTVAALSRPRATELSSA